MWLHGYGNVFEVTLQPGEQIDIEPGGWVFKDPTVSMETIFQRLSTGFFASAGQIFWNRFTGPGRIGLQSMYYHGGTGADDAGQSSGVGGILGAAARAVIDR